MPYDDADTIDRHERLEDATEKYRRIRHLLEALRDDDRERGGLRERMRERRENRRGEDD